MLKAQRYFGAGVANGILYAVGGARGGGDLNTVEAYNPTTDTWALRRPMPTARESVAVGVINGKLYAVGGNANGQGAYDTVER